MQQFPYEAKQVVSLLAIILYEMLSGTIGFWMQYLEAQDNTYNNIKENSEDKLLNA